MGQNQFRLKPNDNPYSPSSRPRATIEPIQHCNKQKIHPTSSTRVIVELLLCPHCFFVALESLPPRIEHGRGWKQIRHESARVRDEFVSDTRAWAHMGVHASQISRKWL